MLPEEIQSKLASILGKKAARAGQFCLDFKRESFPLNITAAFPGYRRYVLEIGCGWGEFTRAYAAQHSDTLVIAIEKKLARVISSGKTQARENIPNIRYLVLDVAWFFAGIFGADQFDEILINFPDPWPKARHHKHRFISPELTAELARICRPGAQLTFATDDYAYTREAAGVLEKSAAWENTQGPYIARSELSGRPRSYFEQLHRDEGALIYFLQYALNRHSAGSQ